MFQLKKNPTDVDVLCGYSVGHWHKEQKTKTKKRHICTIRPFLIDEPLKRSDSVKKVRYSVNFYYLRVICVVLMLSCIKLLSNALFHSLF